MYLLDIILGIVAILNSLMAKSSDLNGSISSMTSLPYKLIFKDSPNCFVTIGKKMDNTLEYAI